jgi:hypothetical protein
MIAAIVSAAYLKSNFIRYSPQRCRELSFLFEAGGQPFLA